MTNHDIEENFRLCIKWIKEHANAIGTNPLFIGWGSNDYDHPWNVHEFENRECSMWINKPWEEINVAIVTYGSKYTQTYGYEKTYVEKWEKSFVGTGMVCGGYKHPFEDLDIRYKEKFLREWKTIKGRIISRIAEIAELDHFEL